MHRCGSFTPQWGHKISCCWQAYTAPDQLYCCSTQPSPVSVDLLTITREIKKENLFPAETWNTAIICAFLCVCFIKHLIHNLLERSLYQENPSSITSHEFRSTCLPWKKSNFIRFDLCQNSYYLCWKILTQDRKITFFSISKTKSLKMHMILITDVYNAIRSSVHNCLRHLSSHKFIFDLANIV